MISFNISKHNNVLCAKATVRLFGAEMDVYSYFIDGILVDTGPRRCLKEFSAFFQANDIHQVVLTHAHEDHCGNASYLNKRGTPIYIHPSAIKFCNTMPKLPLYRRLFWKKREPFSASAIDEVFNSQSLSWQVIEVPGHTQDYIALYNQKEGALFTGDLIVSPKTKLGMPGENMHQIINSLKRLLSYDFQTIYCGHAGVIEKGRAILEKKLANLENLRDEVIQLYHHQCLSILEINIKLFPKNDFLQYVSGKEWASEHIITSFIYDQ